MALFHREKTSAPVMTVVDDPPAVRVADAPAEEEVAGTWRIDQGEQRSRYEALHKEEARIAAAVRNWSQLGDALKTIRDNGLFAGADASFEDYLARRWKDVITPRHAYNLIAAAEVGANLRKHKVQHLLSGRAACALARLPTAEAQAECLRELIAELGTSSPPAKDVRAAVAARLTAGPTGRAKRKKKSTTRKFTSDQGTVIVAPKRITITLKRADADAVALLRAALAQPTQSAA